MDGGFCSKDSRSSERARTRPPATSFLNRIHREYEGRLSDTTNFRARRPRESSFVNYRPSSVIMRFDAHCVLTLLFSTSAGNVLTSQVLPEDTTIPSEELTLFDNAFDDFVESTLRELHVPGLSVATVDNGRISSKVSFDVLTEHSWKRSLSATRATGLPFYRIR